MTERPSTLSDPHRLASLEATGLLDSEPEESFDRYTRLAARLLQADVALMALVTSERQFFKSSVGLPPDLREARETPLAMSLCQHAVTRQAPVVLEDLAEDPVEEAGAVIEHFDLRSYAGVPLFMEDGTCVGSFSVLDRQPRRWSEDEVELLGDLAAAVGGEIELRRRQAEFRQLLENAPIPLAVHSAAGFHYLNEEAVELLGVESAAAVLDMPVLDLVHPDDRPMARERMRRVLEERTPVPTERYRFVRPDGRILRVEARSIPVVHEGRPAIQTAVRDVTEELETRRRLEDIRNRQQLLLEQLPAILWTVDCDLVFTSSTGAGLEGLGLEQDEAVGMSLHEFFDTGDDDFPPIRQHRQALSGQASNYRMEWEGRTYENHLEPLLSEEGQIIGVIGSAFDVTERTEAERERRRTQERYQRLLELAPIGMFVDRDGEILYANAAGARLLGAEDPSEIVGEPVDRFSDPDRREEIRRRIRRVEEEGEATGLEVFPLRTLDGRERLLEIKAIPVEYRGERASLSIARDVTEQVEAKRALRASEERYRRIFEDSKDVIYITDRDGSVAAINPAGEELFGYPREELEGMNVERLYHDPHDRQQFQRAIEGRGYVDDFEVQVETREGEVRDCLITATVRTDDAGEVLGYQGILRDVTERKRFEEELERRALHDPLTGLPNRTLFFDRLEQAVARAERADGRIAVLFVDLDRFKAVNDSLGHAAGDQVLVEVAGRLLSAVRNLDTVARVGGDEFTVLLEGLEVAAEAEDVARRIARALEHPLTGGGEEVHLTCSIGLAHMGVEEGHPSPDLKAADSLVRQADAAMFRAKNRPATHFTTYDPELDVAETARIQRENELRRALEREEFLLHYQPVVSLETGEILSVEPLVRWEHPDRGLLHPGEFLSLAEESGLILPLGASILREACSQVADWRNGPLSGLRLSPNLSAAQFEDPGLMDLVEGLLEEFDLPPECLQLEVTEHLVMRSPERTRQLAGLGVRIAIDDFGTGYSSLSYVRDLAVDALKIDRSFVAGLERSRQDRAIVTTILTLGETLDLTVVAEGVETGEQLRWLREAGCPAAQGFHLARPAPAAEMGEMLASTPRLELS